MAFEQDFYTQARAAGGNDKQILDYIKSGQDKKLKSFYDQATKAGGDDADILSFLGSTNISDEALFRPRRETARDVYKKTLGETGDPAAAQLASTEFKLENETSTFLGAEGATDLTKGVTATIGGGVQAGIDLAKGFTDLIGQESDTLEQLSEENKEKLRMLNATINNTEDIFSPANVGRIIPTLITLPVAYSTKTAAFAIEGVVGYAEARGAEAEIPEALVVGAFAGGLTAGAMKALQSMSTQGKAGQALKYLQDEFSLDDDVVREIEKQWLKFADEPISDESKVKAIIDSLGERGAEFKAAAEVLNPDATKAINKSVVDRQNEIKGLVANADIEGTIRAVEKHKDFATLSFANFRDLVDKNLPGSIKIDIKPLDNLAKEFNKEINNIGPDVDLQNIVDNIKLGQDEGLTVSGLLDLRQDLGRLANNTAKTARARRFKLNKVQEQVDQIIEDVMPEEATNLWGLVKDEYKLMSSLQGRGTSETRNVMGTILSKAGDGQYSYFKVLDMLSKKAASAEDMAELAKAVGPKNMSNFERGLAKQVMSTDNEAVVYSEVFDKLKKIEMVTPQGQQVQKLLSDMSNVFKSDDFINKMNNIVTKQPGQGGAAFTLDLQEKFKYLAAGRFFQFLIRNLDVTKAGVKARRLEDIADVLSKPVKARKFYGEPLEELKNRAIEDTIKRAEQDLIDATKVTVLPTGE